MKYPLRWRIGVMLGLACFSATTLFAGEQPSPGAADGPFVTLFASSLSKFRSACELVFESVERPDLFDSMDARLKRYNDFAGIDRDKPLGIMFAWGKDSTPHIVFLPVIDIDDLLTTATFGVVGFHKVGGDHYEIERVQKPYQVLVRKGYAFIAESAPTIQAIRMTPDQITRCLRDRYDLAIHFDLRQIPMSDKRQMVKRLRTAVIPSLQTGDDEAAVSGRVRRAIGGRLLDLIERVAIDASTLTIGIRLSPDSGHLHIEVEMQAVSKSPLANGCNQCSSRPSQFSAFLRGDPDTAAVAVMNLTATRGMFEEFLGVSEKSPVGDSRLDVVMQLAGKRLGDLSLLAAFKGPDVKTLNGALPNLLSTTNASGQVEDVDEDFGSFMGVGMHSLIPPGVPETVTDWIGSAPEMILGQAGDTLWLGFGSPTNLVDDLQGAILFAHESPAERATLPIVQVQIKGRALPELVASNLLIPNMDAARVREELSRGGDGVNMRVEPVANGIKLTVDFEEGFVRLIGRDWVRQIESLYQQP